MKQTRKRSSRRLSQNLFLLLALLLLLPATLLADTPARQTQMPSLLQKDLAELVELDVSLATGAPISLKRAPSVATVITAAEIETMGAITLDDVLESVPGMHVMLSPLNVYTSNYAIRGITSKVDPQVLLLVNGSPVKADNYGSRPKTFRMPVSMISRVEIIRGPGSAVLGADAFAGVVNVITKEADEIDGTKAGVRAGSFDARHYWAQHGGVYNGWEVALGAEYQKGDGDKDRIMSHSSYTIPGTAIFFTQTPGPLDTHYDTLDANLLLRKGDWAFRAYYNEAFGNGQGPGMNQTYTPESYVKYRLVNSSLMWQKKDVLPDFDVSTTVSGKYYREEYLYQFFPSNILNQVGNPGAYEQNGSLELAGLYRGVANNRIRVVAGTTRYQVDTFQKKNYGPGIVNQYGPLVDISNTPYVYLMDQGRRLLYAAIQDEWSVAKAWELTAGARYDKYSDFGTTVNPRLALVWTATPELTSKLLYGKAFRAPSFGELHLQNNPATIGNADLKPEKVETLELAFDYKPSKTLRLGFNVFQYTIKGLIDYIPILASAPSGTKVAQNANDQNGNGFELEADWLATEAVRVRGNYAYQHAQDSKTHHEMPDVPGQKFWADADWGFLPQWSANAQYVWVADRHRASIDSGRPAIKDYDLVNLTLRRRHIMRHIDLALAVRNVFDEDAREPAPAVVPNDYPMEGRSVWAELKYAF